MSLHHDDEQQLRERYAAFKEPMRVLWAKKRDLFSRFRKRLEEEKIKEIKNNMS